MGRYRALHCSQARHKSADSSPPEQTAWLYPRKLGQNIACCADFDCFVMLALRVNWCIPLLSVVLIDDGPQCCEFDAAKSVTTLPHIRETLKLYPHRKLTEDHTSRGVTNDDVRRRRRRRKEAKIRWRRNETVSSYFLFTHCALPGAASHVNSW